MFIYLRICLSFLNFINICIIMVPVAFTISAGFCQYKQSPRIAGQSDRLHFFGCSILSVQCQTCFCTDSMVGLECKLLSVPALLFIS